MAIKRSEYASVARDVQQTKADEFEGEIDDGLEEKYNHYLPGNIVSIKISSLPSTAVQEEIRRRYIEAGWKTVEFGTPEGIGHVELS